MVKPATLPDKQSEVRQKALQEELRELLDVVGPVPLVDLLIERAFHLRATDIHLDPNENGLRIRLRVDGLLHEVLHVPTPLMPQMVSRLKLMAGMDITERRLAQDGHISSQTLAHQRDIRVGAGPTIHGERLVLRLMPDGESLHGLDELGLEPDQAEELSQHVRASYGMILSVGPVGSGKSTTMYSCLELLNDPSESLVTIEDPVERRIPGVNQIQIDPKIHFNFVEALRGVLRQDPDVMMIGEIRDPETAQIGVRAGLTGVTVLSTLHANDTASTIDVFRDFGIPPMFIADSLQAIVSQRLLRKVCPLCRTTTHPDEAACEILRVDPRMAETVELAHGAGCDACFGTGYAGRTGVFEIMTFDRELRRAILKGAPRAEVMELAESKGMRNLESSAIRKVLTGQTTLEEMHRVLTSFPGD
jgi:type II secretory ATPase GspE/PulE/Tfp pilus assembly ATPase PilB-like protein